MQIATLNLDILPDYIPFTVQCTAATGAVTSPTVDALIIYEKDGTDGVAIVAADEIGNSPFDPVQIPSDAGKTGLWGILVAKSNFTAGKYYICLWQMTIDSVATAAIEIYYCCNATQFMANVTNLDAAVSTRSSHTAANVWAAAARELSTPANYKADVSALALEASLGTVDGNVDTIVGKLPAGIIADEANVQTHAAAALTAYDPPTRTEATADKAEILVGTDAIYDSVDDVLGIVTPIQADTTAILIDTNEIQGKLPAGDIAGESEASSNFSDVIDEVDQVIANLDIYGPAILADTGAILIDTAEMQGKLPAGDIAGETEATANAVAILAILNNATYGLSALKVLMDGIDTSTELAARFTEIKGVGWTIETLKAIYGTLDMPTRPFASFRG